MKFFLLICLIFISILSKYNANTYPTKWIDSKNLSSWYDDIDLCILNNDTKIDSLIIINNCIDKYPQLINNKAERCRVGSAWPNAHKCSALETSFKEKTLYMKSLEGYDDPTLKPLLKLFLKLQNENGALLLMGDSVTQQFYGTLACELERERIWTDHTKFVDTDTIRYVSINDSLSPVPIKFLPIYHFVRGRFDKSEVIVTVKNIVDDYLSRHNSLLIVVNVGLHYVGTDTPRFTRLDYQSQVTMALTYFNTLSSWYPNKLIRIIFRETTAQHFPTSNGYWPGAKFASTMKLICQPINDISDEADWRNNDLISIIKANNFNNIQVIKFYQASLPLWNMHVAGAKQDCTHICATPMLYQYIFHELANAMDRIPMIYHNDSNIKE